MPPPKSAPKLRVRSQSRTRGAPRSSLARSCRMLASKNRSGSWSTSDKTAKHPKHDSIHPLFELLGAFAAAYKGSTERASAPTYSLHAGAKSRRPSVHQSPRSWRTAVCALQHLVEQLYRTTMTRIRLLWRRQWAAEASLLKPCGQYRLVLMLRTSAACNHSIEAFVTTAVAAAACYRYCVWMPLGPAERRRRQELPSIYLSTLESEGLKTIRTKQTRERLTHRSPSALVESSQNTANPCHLSKR